jgi:hypothetical protein
MAYKHAPQRHQTTRIERIILAMPAEPMGIIRMETRREAATAATAAHQVVQKRRSDLVAVQMAATTRREVALPSLRRRLAPIIGRMETER